MTGVKNMTGLVNVGFGNMVNTDKLVAVVSPDGAPIKRLVQNAREAQRVVDATRVERQRRS